MYRATLLPAKLSTNERSLRQLKDELLKSFPVRRTDNREHLRAVIPDAARIELLFRHIDPDKERHLRTSSHVAEKQGLPLANPP